MFTELEEVGKLQEKKMDGLALGRTVLEENTCNSFSFHYSLPTWNLGAMSLFRAYVIGSGYQKAGKL